jgi:hypothetical protein
MPTQREAVVRRAHGCCEYCRAQELYAPDPFSVEHILPASKGGTNELANLAYSCQGCNGRKYTGTEAIDPGTGDIAPLFHPRQHRWDDHFVWNDDYILVIGRTPIGRATVEKLQLNRPGLVNLRRVLFTAGIHPPVI